jgi:hypothetical protein
MTDNLPHGYIALGAGYSYAPLHVGLVLRNWEAKEVYFQPSDDENAIRDTIAAFDELEILPDDRRAMVIDIALADYF